MDPALPLHPSLEVPRQYFDDTLEMSEMLKGNMKPPVVELNPSKDIALLQYTSGVTGIPKGAIITHSNMLFNTICSALWSNVEKDIHLAVLPLFHVTGLIHEYATIHRRLHNTSGPLRHRDSHPGH